MKDYLKYLILEEINKNLSEQEISEPAKELGTVKEKKPENETKIDNNINKLTDDEPQFPAPESLNTNEPSDINNIETMEDDNISANTGPSDTFGLSLGGGGGYSSPSQDSSTNSNIENDKKQSFGLTPPTKPTKNLSNPVNAVMEDAKKVASQTSDPQQILNAIKAAIQANFSNYSQALPIINHLRNTKDKTLNAVADRLTLFIAGF